MYNIMKKYYGYKGTKITRVVKDSGISIEEDLRIKLANKEPIEASSPMYYTERNEGVLPQYDVRTDRQEVALDALEKVEKSNLLRGDDLEKPETEETTEAETETPKDK